MGEILEIPDPKVEMTLEELGQIQAIAKSHITFSMTLACPLRCKHCIVNSGPDLGHTTMPVEVARHYASQMKELADHGIASISFTGGEPLLSIKQVELISQAASDAGIKCGIVTAAHWATSKAAAQKVVDRLSMIRCWDISIDEYHEEFVSLEQIRWAYEAAIEKGLRVTMRFSYNDPPTEEEMRILEFITTLKEAGFSCQRVRAVGRGDSLGLAVSHEHNPWLKPCLTQGMVVRYDASLSPCCLNLVEQREHPFQLGSALDRPLVEIHKDYLEFPLLHLIRAVGFKDLMGWLEEEGLRSRLPEFLPDEVCAICEVMMKDKAIADFLMKKCNESEMRLKIGVLVAKSLGEHFILNSIYNRIDLHASNESMQIAKDLIARVS